MSLRPVLPFLSVLRARAALWSLLLALVSVSGCTLFFGPDVDRIEVTPGTITLRRGETQSFSAISRAPSGGPLNNRTPTATVADPAIVRIAYGSGNGQVTGVTIGTTTIDFEANGKRASIAVTVTPPLPAAVRFDPPTRTLQVGETVTACGTAVDGQGQPIAGTAISYQSQTPAIATVNPATCTITAVSPGTTFIIATAQPNGTLGSLQVSVVNRPITRLAVRVPNDTVRVGERKTLSLQAFGADNQSISTIGRSIRLDTSDPTIVTVDQTGVVTGIRPGSATITATVNETGSQSVTATAPVAVAVNARRVFINTQNADVRLGATAQLRATAVDSTPSAIPNVTFAWRSSDPNVLVIDDLGIVTGRRLGTVRVYATYAGLTDSATVRVTEMPLSTIRLDPLTGEIFEGAAFRFTPTLVDSVGNAATRPVTWVSSNPNVASVNPTTGQITGISPGFVTITAVADRIPGSAAVVQQQATLLVQPIPVATVTVEPASITLARGQNQLVNLILRSASGAELRGRVVSTRSSNTAVAIANITANGTVAQISALGPGTTTITFTAVSATGLDQGTPGTLTVTVTGN
jgi:uncharacterized protein YjdB